MHPKVTTITIKPFPKVSYSRLGEGPAIMLLHGFPVSGILWNRIVGTLSAHFTVLAPDIPGAGDSIVDGEDTSVEELAGIVPAILEHEGFEKCIVAGHSMGGYIALAAAALFPHRLKGLSLVHSTAKADDEEKKEKRRKTIALIRKGGGYSFIRSMVPGLFCNAFRQANEEEIDKWICAGQKLQPQSMIAFYAAMLQRPDRTETIRTADFPVQWIAGADDALIPEKSILQQSPLACVSFVSRYESCGHMSMIEQPEKLTEDLRKFCAYCFTIRSL